jgi:hypothetical protein
MSFPASVEQVTSSRLRRKPTRQRSRLLPWEDQLPEAGEEDARTGVGGPVLDIGREGGATLDKVKGRWGWKWLKQEGRGPSLKVDEGVLLYPACRTPDLDLASVPSSKVADSAVSTAYNEETRTNHDRSTTYGRYRTCPSMPPFRISLSRSWQKRTSSPSWMSTREKHWQ